MFYRLFFSLYKSFLHRDRDRREFNRDEETDQIRVKEEPPDGNFRFDLKCVLTFLIYILFKDYEYSSQQYDGYNQYDAENIKYEPEEPHFQTEEY